MRRPDWQTRLALWARSRAGCAFEWGRTDCALLVAEAVDEITGSHHAAQYRGRYRSAAQALKFQRRCQIDLAVWLEQVGVFRWQGLALFGDVIVHPHPQAPWMVGHVVVGNGLVITAAEGPGVYFGRVADAMAQPGAAVWRIT